MSTQPQKDTFTASSPDGASPAPGSHPGQPKHVRWDERGLEAAESQLASIHRQPGGARADSEPKTPFPFSAGREEEEDLSDFKLSDSSSMSLPKLMRSGSASSAGPSDSDADDFFNEGSPQDPSCKEQFTEHRKRFYSTDGEALRLGRQLIESSSASEQES